MGTSLEMTEKFYGHILTPDIVSSIRKKTKQTTKNECGKSHPF